MKTNLYGHIPETTWLYAIKTVYKMLITAIPLKCERFSKLAVIVGNIWVGTEFVQAHPKTSQQHKPNQSSRSVLSCKQFELRSAVESWDLVLFQLLGHCVCVCVPNICTWTPAETLRLSADMFH